MSLTVPHVPLWLLISAFIIVQSLLVSCEAAGLLKGSSAPGCWRTAPVGPRDGCEYDRLQYCGFSWNTDHTRGACQGITCCTCGDACDQCAVFQKGYRLDDASTGDCITQSEYIKEMAIGVAVLVAIIGLCTGIQCWRHKGKAGPCMSDTWTLCCVIPTMASVAMAGICCIFLAAGAESGNESNKRMEEDRKRFEGYAWQEQENRRRAEAAAQHAAQWG